VNEKKISQSRADTLVVIPTYCEAANIAPFITEVLGAINCDILVVDDDSPDGTGRVVLDHFENDPRVSLLSRRGKQRGLGPAYVDGFTRALEAGHPYVAQMDADFSHRPAELPRLREAASRADLVVGSRYVEDGRAAGLGKFRRLVSQGGSLYARAILGLPIRDVTGGFKCWRRETLEVIEFASVASTGFAFQIEMNYRVHKKGLSMVEVPITFDERRSGASKMSTGIFLEGLAAVWRVRLGRWR